MGVVYEAKHLSLDRLVAIKLMQRDDGLHQARFLAEGQIIAAVKHPNVVEVFDFGECSVGPFIAMEYLTGGSFSQRLKGGTALPPREAAELIAKIAAGVGAAHDIGIVHRDLKPGNVLLDSNGNPKVTDFGLAKRTDFDLTLTHEAAGTPSYMAPEQARAMKFVGPPADVWSLGVMLYESLTGRKPFVAETDVELLISIQNADPPTLRTLSKTIPHDLETICLKCLEKDPERRYATAKELAADLSAWLDGKAIAARRATAVEKAMLWVRRKPASAASWAMGLLAVVMGTFAAMAGILWQNAEQEKGIAESARITAERAQSNEHFVRKQIEQERQKLEVFDYGRTMQVAHQEWRDGNSVAMRVLLDGADPKLRGWEWGYLIRLSDSFSDHSLLTLKGHANSVSEVSYSSDGTRIVTCSQADGTAKVWNSKTGDVVLELKGHRGGRLNAASFSPDGKRIIVCTEEEAKVCDAQSGVETLALKGHTHIVHAASFSPDGLWIITGCYDGTAKVWNAKTGAEIITLFANAGSVSAVTFSPDGTQVITLNGERLVKVWDAKTGVEGLTLRHAGSRVFAVSFSPDGKRIVTGSEDRTAKIWDVKTGEETLTLKGHNGSVFAASFSPDGNRIATGSEDMTTKIWDLKTGTEELTLEGHKDAIQAVTFSPDGTRIVSGSRDRSVKVWDAKRGTEVLALNGHTGSVYSASFSPEGKRLVTGSMDKSAKVWDTNTGLEVLALIGHTDFVMAASFNSNGMYLATGSSDGTAKVWDAKTGSVLRTIKGHTGSVFAASFSPNDRWIVTGSSDSTAKVWDAKSGTEVLNLMGHTGDVRTASYSPDGTRIVTGSGDRTAKVWDAKTGVEMITLKGHMGRVNWASFNQDGTRIVTGSSDRTAKVWDAKTGVEMITLKGHTGSVNGASFSPDGTRIVTGSGDKTAKVWEAKTGAETLTLKGHTEFRRKTVPLPAAPNEMPAPKPLAPKSNEKKVAFQVYSTGESDIRDPSQLLQSIAPSLAVRLQPIEEWPQRPMGNVGPGFVHAASFSPDGMRIVTCSDDGTAKIWDSRPVGHEFLHKGERK
ncbi:MAG: protein kinase [Gemmataceae bacterium]|nr:protein kinase [Gemmataceae bacterium]